jgi:plastocyanin
MLTKRNKLLLSILMTVIFSANAHADEIEIGLLDMAFIKGSDVITTIDIKVGDTLSFKNYDPFNHDIYSASAEATFDLGVYPQGQSKVVKFDKPGKIDVECSIHESMHLTVNVKRSQPQ